MILFSDVPDSSINATFFMTIYQTPQFIEKIAKKLDLMASNEAKYSLPINYGAVGEYVIH